MLIYYGLDLLPRDPIHTHGLLRITPPPSGSQIRFRNSQVIRVLILYPRDAGIAPILCTFLRARDEEVFQNPCDPTPAKTLGRPAPGHLSSYYPVRPPPGFLLQGRAEHLPSLFFTELDCPAQFSSCLLILAHQASAVLSRRHCPLCFPSEPQRCPSQIGQLIIPPVIPRSSSSRGYRPVQFLGTRTF